MRWREFHPKRIADRILGMGDIVSLVERASETIDAEKAAAMAKKMQSGKFDLDESGRSASPKCRTMGGMGQDIHGLDAPGMGKDAGPDGRRRLRRQKAFSRLTSRHSSSR